MPILPLGKLPDNELGVVYLFADYARRHKLQVRSIQAGFPDALVTRRTAKGEEEFRVEFEFRARSFKKHHHDPKKADWVVCWENNWADAPKNLKIVALNEYYGYGRSVYLQYMSHGWEWSIEPRQEYQCEIDARARTGDVLLLFSCLTYGACKEVGWGREEAHKDRLFAVARVTHSGPHQTRTVRSSTIRCLVKFEPCMALQDDVLSHPSIRLEGAYRRNVTQCWEEIRRRIVSKRPANRKALEQLG